MTALLSDKRSEVELLERDIEELCRLLTEIRKILIQIPHPLAAKAVELID